MPKNINCITTIIHLEGIEKVKTEKKKDNKTVCRIFPSPVLEENINKHLNGFSIFIGCFNIV